METIRFRFESLSSKYSGGILMSNPAAMQRRDGAPSAKKIPTPEAEAESLVYRLPDTKQLYVPADWFRSAALQACKGMRIGKTAAAALLKAGVFLTDPYCPLVDPHSGDPITTYALDTRRCVVQRQGVLRTRPWIKEWATETEFEHDPEMIGINHLQGLFERAGKIIGVGGYRVERGGPFGRFEVSLVSSVATDGKAKGKRKVDKAKELREHAAIR